MSVKQRELFEAAVVDRLKESGFLEVEIRTEALHRADDGYQDEVINAGWYYWNAALSANEIDFCPVCAEILNDDDLCATDIELGICHAACLEGSPVVDIDTDEPLPDAELATYRFGDLNA